MRFHESRRKARGVSKSDERASPASILRGTPPAQVPRGLNPERSRAGPVICPAKIGIPHYP